MTTELKLAETLKQLMATRSLDQITVKNLIELSAITRPTFYYHFHDIYDLLAWIFLNETIDGLDKVKSWADACGKIGRYCLNNRHLVRQTLQSAGKDLLLEFLNNNLYAFHMRRLAELDVKASIPEETKKQIALFYSAATNALITDWIDAGMKAPLAESTATIGKYVGSSLEDLVKGEVS